MKYWILFSATLSLALCYLTIIFTGVFTPKIYKAAISQPIEIIRNIGSSIKDANTPYTKHFWRPEKSPEKGVTINKKSKSYNGYTFFTGTDEYVAKLVDQNGNTVHEWGKHPKDIWLDRKKYKSKKYKNTFTTDRAILDPETGDAYIIYGSRLSFPKEIGLVKFNKNNDVEWAFNDTIHHHAAISPDKKHIYALTKKIINDKFPGIHHIDPPYLDEEILIIDANGKEIKRISILELFINSNLKIVIDKIHGTPEDPTFHYGDLLHSNTIEIVPNAAIGKAPMLKKGHLLLSFRNLDLLVMVDPVKEEITWASYGPWEGQHDPEIQNDGSIILFDNLGNLHNKESGASRVLQVDLNTLAIMWEYTGNKDQPFFSPYNSMVHPLPNGNILVTESHPGRIFEVTKDKEIVWEYINPQRRNVKKSYHGAKYHNTRHIAAIFSGQRHKKSELKWLQQNTD